MIPLRFWTAGVPTPKGSPQMAINRRTGKPFPAKDNPRVKVWEKAVRAAALEAMSLRAGLYESPVRVRFTFYLPRPKTVKRAVPSCKPDWDKLARSTGDALNGVAWKDDGLVVQAVVSKRYAEPQPGPGVYIEIELWRGDPQ